MVGYIIVKLVADAIAAKEGIVSQFNSYIHKTLHTPSFVHETEGYFSLPCNEESIGTSAGLAAFGKFLQSTGYSVTGISSKEASEGASDAEVSFTKDGCEAHIIVSTLNACKPA